MPGVRVLAAACAMLAAWPAAGQDGALRQGLDGMAESIASLLNDEAQRAGGEPPRVSFRPAWSESQGVRYYCGPLSRGLRDALHERVQRWRDRMSLSSFAIAIADERNLSPPEATLQWRWDGAASVEATARVQLPGRRGSVISAQLNVDALDGGQRDCLFSFRPAGRDVKATRTGFLREDPTFDPRRVVHRFASGEEFFVQGELVGRGGVWSVVYWEDPDTGERRNLFTMDLGGPVTGIEVRDVFRDCPHCPQMVVVPAGSFEMGSPSSEEGRFNDEGPVHRVTISSPFAVGVHEVTRGEFGRFVSATGRAMGDSCVTYEDGEWRARSGRDWLHPGFSQSDSHPVVCVSWNDARAYAEWLSGETGEPYRLLSEAEWEYVARAGTRTARYWGESVSGQCDYANGAAGETPFDWSYEGCKDGYKRTSPVGKFSMNAFGLRDVLGNVWEWGADCWREDYTDAPLDGSAWLPDRGEYCSVRVLRGGSWLFYPWNLRSAKRNREGVGARYSNAGFRMARTLTP